MQIDLFDIIKDITNIQTCEICKQESTSSVCSDKCLEVWQEIVFGWCKITCEEEKND